ncbi:MAG TPA: hypothetical protein VNO30_22660 [Kofleriaceae bacterium]|nr:hypothetical protein [Kofleriaceae bacterium]
MIRVVPTGDLGLDVLLGGGWRLVKRFEERESATVVVRGGSGVGKTLVSIQAALELASALGGDVAVGCVEILPTEYIAQLQSARPSLALSHMAMLPARATAEAGPRVYVGLLPDIDSDKPDLVEGLEQLARQVAVAGGKPVVFVVDSIIEGYGIGSSAQRIDVDDVMKFAANYGYGLILSEEVGADGPSPWMFAADTVLQLGVEARARGRWIEVRKHRFGPSATGRHDLELGARPHPEVFPAVTAWLPPWIPSILLAHGWHFRTDSPGTTQFRWNGSPELGGALFLVASQRGTLAQSFAEALSPVAPAFAEADRSMLLIRFDALTHVVDHWRRDVQYGTYIPVAHGAVRALRWMVERFADMFGEQDPPVVSRIVVGDLAQVLASGSAEEWVEAVRTFASLVNASSWGVPIVGYETLPDGGVPRRQLAFHADIVVVIDSHIDSVSNQVGAIIYDRWRRQASDVRLPVPPSPSDLTTRPPGRA